MADARPPAPEPVPFSTAVRRRRMARNFDGRGVEPDVLHELLDLARRAPSAGNAQGTAFVVLEGEAQVGRYWNTALPERRRAGFRWPGLLRAPVLIVVVASPDRYVNRYQEPDKASTGLGVSAAAWTVPYWFVDAGAAVEHLLVGAVATGLGACFFGLFEREAAVLAELGVPAGWRGVGTVALGHPAPDTPGRSAARPRRAWDDVVHRGGW